MTKQEREDFIKEMVQVWQEVPNGDFQAIVEAKVMEKGDSPIDVFIKSSDLIDEIYERLEKEGVIKYD